MKKRLAILGVILGSLTLSLELCLLPIMQWLETVGAHRTDIIVIRYAFRFPCSIAFLITIAVIIVSILVFFSKD